MSFLKLYLVLFISIMITGCSIPDRPISNPTPTPTPSVLVSPTPTMQPISTPTPIPGLQGKIVFTSNRDYIYDQDMFEIYRMNADGTNLKRLTYHNANSTNPKWSPDGTKIVYVSDYAQKYNTKVYLIDQNGGNLTQLSNLSRCYYPSWSPDGN